MCILKWQSKIFLDLAYEQLKGTEKQLPKPIINELA
jgi:hypothetical protein